MGETSNVCAFLRQSTVGQVRACLLGISHVDITYYVNNATVRLFGQTLVLAAIASLHVENGDVQSFCPDDGEARVCVAKHEHGVGSRLHHQLITAVDYVSHRSAEVVAYCVHINVGVVKV